MKQQFGWQNIIFSLPDNWNLSLVEGNREKGYLRIDDSFMPRVELRWENSYKKVDIKKVVDTYIKKLTKNKSGRKWNIPVGSKVPIGVPLVKRNVNCDCKWSDVEAKLYKYEFFIWECRVEDASHAKIDGEIRTYNLIRYCCKCKRIIFIAVFSKFNEKMKNTVEKIFASIKDHPEHNTSTPQGCSTWGVYGLVFQIPDNYHLKNHTFKSGHIQLCFTHRKNKLQVERLSLANIVLKETKIDDWFRNFFKKDLKRYNYSIDPVDSQKFYLNGREKMQLFPYLKILGLKYINAVIWNCEQENKIYVVQSITKNNDKNLLNFVSRSVGQSLPCPLKN